MKELQQGLTGLLDGCKLESEGKTEHGFKCMKEKIKQFIFILVIFGLINGLGYLAFTSIDNKLYEPNCWEEKIEGINTQTGIKAYYSDNFRCKYFKSAQENN